MKLFFTFLIFLSISSYGSSATRVHGLLIPRFGEHFDTKQYEKGSEDSFFAGRLSNTLPVSTKERAIKNLIEVLDGIKAIEIGLASTIHNREQIKKYLKIFRSSSMQHIRANAFSHYEIFLEKELKGGVCKIRYRVKGKKYTAFTLRKFLDIRATPYPSETTGSIRALKLNHELDSYDLKKKLRSKKQQKDIRELSRVPVMASSSKALKPSAKFLQKLLDPKEISSFTKNNYLYLSELRKNKKHLKLITDPQKIENLVVLKKFKNGICKVSYSLKEEVKKEVEEEFDEEAEEEEEVDPEAEEEDDEVEEEDTEEEADDVEIKEGYTYSAYLSSKSFAAYWSRAKKKKTK